MQALRPTALKGNVPEAGEPGGTIQAEQKAIECVRSDQRVRQPSFDVPCKAALSLTGPKV